MDDFFGKLKKLSFNKSDNQVDLLLNLFKESKPFTFVRFNDGEMMGIKKVGAVAARGDQKINKELHKKLIEGIKHTQDNYYVGLPCPICFPNHAKLARELVNQPQKYQLNATAMTNRNWGKFITQFPNIVQNKKILWISGDDQNLDYLINIMNLNIINHIKHPVKDTWNYYKDIYNEYMKFKKNNKDFDIIMISSGPTARVLSKEFFEIDPTRTYIDIGSTFDPFTRNVWHNCHKGWLETGFNKTKSCKICN